MAAVAAGLDAGDLGLLRGVRDRQLEVLDLVPVVREGLRHHRLLVLAGDVDVAGGARRRALELVVGLGAQGVVTDFGRPLSGERADEEAGEEEKGKRRSAERLRGMITSRPGLGRSLKGRPATGRCPHPAGWVPSAGS